MPVPSTSPSSSTPPSYISLAHRAFLSGMTTTVARKPGFASLPLKDQNTYGTINPEGTYGKSVSDGTSKGSMDSLTGLGPNAGPISGPEGFSFQIIKNATAHGWPIGVMLYPEGMDAYDVNEHTATSPATLDKPAALYLFAEKVTTQAGVTDQSFYGSALAWEMKWNLDHPNAPVDVPVPDKPPVATPTTPPTIPPVNPSPVPPPPSSTTPDIYTLHLASTGLNVSITFHDPRFQLSPPQHAQIIPSHTTPDYGSFWFFGESNVEVGIKLLRFNTDTILIFCNPYTDVAWNLRVSDVNGVVYSKDVEAGKPVYIRDAFKFSAG